MSSNPPSGAAPAPSGPKPPPKPASKVKYNPLIQRKKPLTNAKPQAKPAPTGSASASAVRKQAAPAAVAASSPGTPSEEEEYEDIPIYTTRRSLMEGKRHHVLKFAPKFSAAVQKLHPADQSQFTRPIHLHRRDPRWNPSDPSQTNGPTDEDPEAKVNAIDEKEKARLAQLKVEKEKTREENMKQVAPVANTQKNQKQPKFKKSTEQVYKFTDLAEKQKNMEIRYEEKLPWHIEDFDYKQIWQGNYESALSGNFIVLVPGIRPAGVSHDGKMEKVLRMIPLEKWYKFSRKNHYKSMSFAEANAEMNKKYRDPAFLTRAKAQAAAEKAKEASMKANRKLFTRKGERGETTRVKNEDDFEGPDIAEDVDDIDFNYEEDFADDEENDIFGTDDKDEKDEAVNKIKRDQRQANVFELREEKDYDKEEEEEEEKKEKQKKQSRKVQKALMRRERNLAYEDSDDSLFDSSNDSEVDVKEEDIKKEDEEKEAASKAKPAPNAKGKEKDEKAKNADKPSSGASTKGTNTPKGRPPKNPTDPLRKVLKRPGSPMLSEASGSESTRKRPKKSNGPSALSKKEGAASPGPGSPLSGPPSASTSPMLQATKPDATKSRKRSRGTAASGSEGEMSEGAAASKTAKRQAPGLARAASTGSLANSVVASPSGSPTNSRPGSPVMSPLAAATSGGEGEGETSNPRPKKKQKSSMPTLREIAEAIPSEGIRLGEFADKYPRLKKSADFALRIKAAACLFRDSEGKGTLIKPKGEGPEGWAAYEKSIADAGWDLDAVGVKPHEAVATIPKK